MKIIEDYKIVKDNFGRVQDSVNELISQGYIPFGSLCYGGSYDNVAQAMVKYEDVSRKTANINMVKHAIDILEGVK